MNNKEKVTLTVFFTVICISCFPKDAYAYIDPMTGSMILQAIGAAFIAIGGAWAIFRGKVKAFFSKDKGAEATHSEKVADGEEADDGEVNTKANETIVAEEAVTESAGKSIEENTASSDAAAENAN